MMHTRGTPEEKQPDPDGANRDARPTVKYAAVRLASGTSVARVDDTGAMFPLPLRTDLRNHSPTGFEWGYSGSGPAQLALAILADAVGAERARACYQRFKFEVVARFDRAGWELSRDAVLGWYRQYLALVGDGTDE